MTIQEIRTFYNYFTTTADEVGLVLYVVLEVEGVTVIRQADIDAATILELRTLYLDSLARVILDDDIAYTTISQADARKNIFFRYDLQEIPAGLQVLSDVLEQDEYPIFNFANDNFENIKSLVITIGNAQHKIALYKIHSQLNLIRGARVFNIRYTNERFERVREDIIKLSSKIDFFQIGEHLFILNVNALERGFNFENIIRNKAVENIGIIEALALLEDVEPLNELITELKFAKKVMGIRTDSPVLQVPVPAILNFVRTHPPIMRKLRVNDDGTRLRLHTKTSRILFLKLINDDLLTSTLTQRYYDSLAKDNMDVNNEEINEE